MCEDRERLGSFAHLPDLRRNPVLRQLAESAREQTCPRQRPSGDRLGRTRGALALLLPGRRLCSVLTQLAWGRGRATGRMRVIGSEPASHPVFLAAENHDWAGVDRCGSSSRREVGLACSMSELSGSIALPQDRFGHCCIATAGGYSRDRPQERRRAIVHPGRPPA